MDDGIVRGFSWCSIYGKSGRLEIVEVLSSHRGAGYGSILVEKTLELLKNRGVLVIDVECAPITSEPFWRRFGFKDLTPGTSVNGSRSPQLYKPIAEHAYEMDPPVRLTQKDIRIELWNSPPWNVDTDSATWIWQVPVLDGGILKTPVIHSVNIEWRLRVTVGDRELHDDQVKRLQTGREKSGKGFEVQRYGNVR